MASDHGYSGTTAKTASYTVTVAENGTVFTNRGASGTIVFTLPAPFANAHYRFITHAAQIISVAPDVTDTLVAYGDSVAKALLTPAGAAGCETEVWSDGTSWYAVGVTELATYVVTA